MAIVDHLKGPRVMHIRAEIARAQRNSADMFAALSGEFDPNPEVITHEMLSRTEAVLGAFSHRHGLTPNYQITDVVQGYFRDYFDTYLRNAANSTADPDQLVLIGSTMARALQKFVAPVAMKEVNGELVPNPTTEQQLIGESDHKSQLVLHLTEQIYLGHVGDSVLRLVESGITKDVPTLYQLQNAVLQAMMDSDPGALRSWISSKGSQKKGNIYEKTLDKIGLMEAGLRLQSRRTLKNLYELEEGTSQLDIREIERVYADVLGGHKAALEGRYEKVLTGSSDERLDAIQGIMTNDFMTSSMRAVINLQAKIKTDPEMVGGKTKAAAKNARKVSSKARREATFHKALRTTIIPSESLLEVPIVVIGSGKPELNTAVKRLFLVPNKSSREEGQVRFAGLKPQDAMLNRTRDIIPIYSPQVTTDPKVFDNRVSEDIDIMGAYAQASTEFHMTRAQNAVGLVEKALHAVSDTELAYDAAAYLTYIVTDLTDHPGEINTFKGVGKQEILDELIHLHFTPVVPEVLRQALEHSLQEIAANWTVEDQKYLVDNFLSAGGKDPSRYFGNGKMAQFLFKLIYLDHDNVPNIPDKERTTEIATYIHEKLRDRVRGYAQWDNGTNLHRSILDETAPFDILQNEVTVLGEPTVADVQLVIQHLHELKKVNPNMPFVQTITDRWGAVSSLSASELVDVNEQPISLSGFISANKLNRKGANMRTWAQDYKAYQDAVAALKKERPRIVLDDIVDAASFAATALERDDLFLAFAETLTREIQDRITPSGGIDVLSNDYQTRLQQIERWIMDSSSPEALTRIAAQMNPIQVLSLVRGAMTDGVIPPAIYDQYAQQFRAALTQVDFQTILNQQKALHNLGLEDARTMGELLRPLLTAGDETSSLNQSPTGEITGAIQAVVGFIERSRSLQAQTVTAMATTKNPLADGDVQISTSNADLYRSRVGGVTVLEAGITKVYQASVQALSEAIDVDQATKTRIKDRLTTYFDTAMALIRDSQQAMDAYSAAVTAGIRVHSESARVLATETEHVANQRRYYVRLARSRMKTLYHMDDPKELIGSQKRIDDEQKRIRAEEEKIKSKQQKPEPEE